MTQKIGRFRVEKGRQVGRSKISENRRTSLMDVPLSNIGHHCLQCPNGPAILFILEIWVIFWFFLSIFTSIHHCFCDSCLNFQIFWSKSFGQNTYIPTKSMGNICNCRQQVKCQIVDWMLFSIYFTETQIEEYKQRQKYTSIKVV